MKRKIWTNFITVFLGLMLVSCGGEAITQDEYDDLKSEVETLQSKIEELEKKIGNGDSDSRGDTEGDLIEVPEQRIEITLENVYDYVDFVVVDVIDSFGEKTGEQGIAAVSKVYDDGYVLRGYEDFLIEYSIGDNILVSSTGLYSGFITRISSFNYYEGELHVSRVKGTLIFTTKEYVEEYTIEDGLREVVFVDGKKSSSKGDIYKEYPY